MNYIIRIDSIRALAAILVIIWHWIPKNYYKGVPLGSIGVNIFFVLSGFLITSILLQAKMKNISEQKSQLGTIKSFIARRALRIFPIYYLTIGIVYFSGGYFWIGMQKNIWYFLTYTSNFYYYSIEKLTGVLAVTWTLAIEEQFYLFFPWLILLTKRNHTFAILIASVLIGTMFNPLFIKLIFVELQFYLVDIKMAHVVTPSAFDSLGMGSLLGYTYIYKPQWENTFIKATKVLALIALALIIGKIFSIIKLPIKPLCISLFCLGLISAVVYQKKYNLFDVFLKNRVFLFLGRISYGLYIYHLLIQHVYRKITKLINIEILANIWISFVFKFIFLVTVAWLSYTLIERPILRLKKYLPY